MKFYRISEEKLKELSERDSRDRSEYNDDELETWEDFLLEYEIKELEE